MNIEFMHGVTLWDFISLFWFIAAWMGYTAWADSFNQKRTSLMSVMYEYRLQWMRESLHREVRVADAALLSTLIRSISLFASTAIFIIGGTVAMFGGLEQIRDLTAELTYVAKASKVMWEIKLLTLALVFIYAFFKFAWALRQFNYMLIVMGAFPAPDRAETPEALAIAERAARVNALAVQTFNRGMRAYYFGMAALAWFIHPWIFVGATLLVVLVIYRREFKSKTLLTLDPRSDYEAVFKS
ncbi:conserved membrane hypothetical protein [Candidatus Terasakiella magnetica]|uniref:DUF599 domain-containing protein n=1 Tax=Candidatus Terasakiella magnetica TaxID=1867952 RepID=A0A1C3RLG1_9PROT|nr:DUF599 family protein [Candidatus Terasakiella magnetica]SCA58078.1 conserved membrane hypothetical protein [Candidatus Terasakiella magnetica]